MMAEYIEREAAIKALQPTHAPAINEVLASVLRRVPAADVVEVVRCRDCKHRAEDDFCTGRGWPDQLVADDGFCEKGKRKEGGQDE